MWVKAILLFSLLIAIAFGAWYYSIPTSGDILVLDRTVLTVVMDDIPSSREGAISVAQKEIINVTSVPKRSFDRYFRLMNISNTPFQWQLVYNVTDNPDLTVLLVKKISPEEGFRISDEHIVNMVGRDYFDAHFEKKVFESNTAHYLYRYLHNSSEEEMIELSMWVRLGYDRSVIGRHVVTSPQEITVSAEQAIDISRNKGLEDHLSAAPVLVEGIICWRVLWQHTPTEEDYDNHTLYGFDAHCTTGEVIGEHRYVRPTPTVPPPIQVSQVTSLIEKLGFEEIEDGAVIQVRVMNSSNEEFSVVKTFGRILVKEGTIENADLTLWIDRELILNALESDNAVSYLQSNANSRTVIVELHKNVVQLQKKGYMTLYEKLK
jgi:hypothetical protein